MEDLVLPVGILVWAYFEFICRRASLGTAVRSLFGHFSPLQIYPFNRSGTRAAKIMAFGALGPGAGMIQNAVRVRLDPFRVRIQRKSDTMTLVDLDFEEQLKETNFPDLLSELPATKRSSPQQRLRTKINAHNVRPTHKSLPSPDRRSAQSPPTHLLEHTKNIDTASDGEGRLVASPTPPMDPPSSVDDSPITSRRGHHTPLTRSPVVAPERSSARSQTSPRPTPEPPQPTLPRRQRRAMKLLVMSKKKDFIEQTLPMHAMHAIGHGSRSASPLPKTAHGTNFAPHSPRSDYLDSIPSVHNNNDNALCIIPRTQSQQSSISSLQEDDGDLNGDDDDDDGMVANDESVASSAAAASGSSRHRESSVDGEAASNRNVGTDHKQDEDEEEDHNENNSTSTSQDGAKLLERAKDRIARQELLDQVALLKTTIERKNEELENLHGQLRRAVATKCDLVIAHNELEKTHATAIQRKEQNLMRMKQANIWLLEAQSIKEKELLNEIVRLTDQCADLESKHRDELDDWERMHRNEMLEKDFEIAKLSEELRRVRGGDVALWRCASAAAAAVVTRPALPLRSGRDHKGPSNYLVHQ
jgi:hypothetical protein